VQLYFLDLVMPFFTDPNEAKRYLQSRPYFHPIAIKRAKEMMGIDSILSLGVDVACGTGQFTMALNGIAKRVIGFDISWNMLATAMSNKGRQYIQARAEAMPLQNSSVPIISCALALHWFDREQFFSEAWRVLDNKGWLFIYNNGFKGIMRENPLFSNWGQQVYGRRFPVPPRDSRPITSKVARQLGFELVKEDSYENDISLTPEELVSYLRTQTNVMAAIQQDRGTLESASNWLLDQVSSFFINDRATFVFGTRAWYLKKSSIH
jgi:SAM-dependent methyltransferase